MYVYVCITNSVYYDEKVNNIIKQFTGNFWMCHMYVCMEKQPQIKCLMALKQNLIDVRYIYKAKLLIELHNWKAKKEKQNK